MALVPALSAQSNADICIGPRSLFSRRKGPTIRGPLLLAGRSTPSHRPNARLRCAAPAFSQLEICFRSPTMLPIETMSAHSSFPCDNALSLATKGHSSQASLGEDAQIALHERYFRWLHQKIGVVLAETVDMHAVFHRPVTFDAVPRQRRWLFFAKTSHLHIMQRCPAANVNLNHNAFVEPLPMSASRSCRMVRLSLATWLTE